MKSIREDEFLKKYGRIMEITKVSMHISIIKALMHFWDPEYQYFTFGNINMCPTMEEYGLLTKFPPNLYKVYFYQRRDKVLTKFAKLIKVLDFHKIIEKSATSLK